MRILGRATSINVRKVLWACEEISIAYTRADEGPELAANPNRLVPVIVDGDFVLWESNTIIRYLGNKYSAESLLPRDPRGRAEIDRWIDWQATEFNTAWRYAFSALVRRDPAFADPAQVEASRREWNRMVGIVEAQLATTGAYIAGGAFTLADVPIGLSINRWMQTPMAKPSLRCVASYYARLVQRPAFCRWGRDSGA